jgi:glyceraldehyde 3-phosphate dehydrogenase
VKTESLIILNVTFQSRAGKDGKISAVDTAALNEIYRQAEARDPERLLVYSEGQNVSSDVAGINASIVIEGQFNHTRTALIPVDLSQIPGLCGEGKAAMPVRRLEIPVVHAKIFGWYDNEYGSYTNRMGDLTVHAHKMLK